MAKVKLATENAAIHFAAGVLDAQEVPVGLHPLTGIYVAVAFPEGAAVERMPGSLGDGYDEYTATSKGVSLAAVLLFLKKCGHSGPKAKALWLEAIREAIEHGGKAEDNMPVEALQALHEIKLELSQHCQGRRKTPAKRIGLDLATVTVERA